MKAFAYDNEDLIIFMYVQPNAKQDKVVGIFNNQFKIQIKAPAVENKANLYLQEWLAKEFKVSKSSVTLLKGEHARQKTFKIIKPKQLPLWLEGN